MSELTYTRCPGCATVFRVTAEQLALREGQVRCGQCRAVFDANDHVVAREASPLAPAGPAGAAPESSAVAAVPPGAAPQAETAPATAVADGARQPDAVSKPPSAPPTVTADERGSIDITAVLPAEAAEKTVFGGAAQAVAGVLQEAQLGRLATGAAFPGPSAVEAEAAAASPGDATGAVVEAEAQAAGNGPQSPADATAAADARAADAAAMGEEQATQGEAAADEAAEAEVGEAAADAAAEAEVGAAADRPHRHEWKARRQLRERPKALYALAVAVLVLTLALQAVYGYRDLLAAHAPMTRPFLQAACSLLGCVVEPLRDTAALSIEASDLRADPAHRGLLLLTATIRNRAAYAIAYPHLELTLTDASDHVVARRAFAPAEYVGGTANPATGIAGDGERIVKLFLDASATSQAGYRLYLFYP